jgi:hypothetical protein
MRRILAFLCGLGILGGVLGFLGGVAYWFAHSELTCRPGPHSAKSAAERDIAAGVLRIKFLRASITSVVSGLYSSSSRSIWRSA